jgi:outer membrane protein
LFHGVKNKHQNKMKKIVTILVVVMGLVLAGNSTKAQNKFGYISLQELVPSMPEYKKADTAMNDFQTALGQQYDDMRKEFQEQDSLLSGKDTSKYTKAQLELKRKNLGELYGKLNQWQQQAQQMSQQKQQELLAPITKKATEAIQAVAKENGFTYIFTKEQLVVYPPSEDILALVKKKLGVR